MRFCLVTNLFKNGEEKQKTQDIGVTREAKKNSVTKTREVSLALIMQSLEINIRDFQISSSSNCVANQNMNWFLRGGFPENNSTSS